MRVNVVDHARKEQGMCMHTGCNTKIGVNDPYKWIKARYGPRRVFCGLHFPRPSEMTSSDKLSVIYGAREDIEDTLGVFMSADNDSLLTSFDDLVNALESGSGSVNESADEYEMSADNIEQYFSNSPKVDEIREKAEKRNR